MLEITALFIYPLILLQLQACYHSFTFWWSMGQSRL